MNIAKRIKITVLYNNNFEHTHIYTYAVYWYSIFSGNYIHDFKLLQRKTMTFSDVLEFSNVSSSQCAKLCIEQEGATCKSFAFCNTTSLCRLTSSHPRQAGNVVSQSDTCDLYSSKLKLPYVFKLCMPHLQKTLKHRDKISRSLYNCVLFLLWIGERSAIGC